MPTVEKKLENLYTRDSKNKIRVFECFVESGGLANDSYFVTSGTGLLMGKIIYKRELVKQGKNKGKSNETNPFSQALLQADSLWRAKWNEGYKSIRALKAALNPGTWQIDHGTDIDVITQANKYVPQWSYTNENWDELPMLAVKYRDMLKHLDFPYLCQPKFNGVRCMAKWDRPGQVMHLLSRGGTYYTVPHIANEVLELMMYLSTREIRYNIMFDGELYKHGVPLQSISGAARTDDEGLLIGSNSWLEYHIYDVINLDILDQREDQREANRLAVAVIAADRFPHLKFVKSRLVLDELEVQESHDDYIKLGFEGAILRHPSNPYQFNQRSKGLIKVKSYIDEEFLLLGCTTDSNKSIEESFVFILQNNTNGKQTFEARPTGSAAMKKYWYENQVEWIGREATVRFQERSKDGLPIQGHLRADLTEVLHIRPDGE